MVGNDTSPLSRWLPVVSVVFGIFVLFQMALFSWLILRSLSQREVDRVLLSARQDATAIAEQLEEAAKEDQDLFIAVAVEQETRTYINDVLLQRDLVQQVEITDSDGIVVYSESSTRRIAETVQPELNLEAGEAPSPLRQEREEAVSSWEVREEIGDLGWLRVSIDRVEMEQRVAELRSDLIRRTVVIGVITLVMLIAAYLLIWWLLRRARRLEKTAKETERMAYLGTLAAGLAHEIRNPLNSLSLNMQMLEEDLEEEEEGAPSRRLLAITKSEIQRLEHLATNFLSYARSRPLERRQVAAVELLEDAADALAGEVEVQGAEVRIVDDSGGARVSVDPGQIQQLLINLLKNALVATEGLARSPRIRLRAAEAGGQVQLEVEDNGRGLTEEERQRMFDLFFSTRKGGTGLGLAIVERIARAHGGRLSVESEPRQGCLVRLELPLAGRGGRVRPAPAVAPPVGSAETQPVAVPSPASGRVSPESGSGSDPAVA